MRLTMCKSHDPRPRLVRVWPLALLLALCAGDAAAQTRTHRSVGVVQTGLNDRCGDPIWTLFGLPVGPESQGTFLGRKDPDVAATDAIALTPDDCLLVTNANELVASTYDSAFGAFRGWIAPNANLLNLSMRSLPVPAGNGVYAPIPLAGSVPPNPLPPTVPEPATPVSIEKWMGASGDLEIVCDDGAGTATIAVKMNDLIAHGVYTVWGHWSEGVALLLAPFGGQPNLIVADQFGSAEYCREVEFCPLDLAPDGSQLQFMSVLYQGDGAAFGAIPYEAFSTKAFVGLDSLPFLSSIPAGTLAFDQLGFRINATGGPDPGPTSPIMCIAPPVAAASITPHGIAALCVLISFSTILFTRRTAKT